MYTYRYTYRYSFRVASKEWATFLFINQRNQPVVTLPSAPSVTETPLASSAVPPYLGPAGRYFPCQSLGSGSFNGN